MRIATKTISAVDFLAPAYQLTYNYETRRQTCFNGLLSIGIAMITLVFGSLLGKELFLKETPIVSLSEAQEEQISVRLYDYPVVFSFQDTKTFTYLNKDPVFMQNIKVSTTELKVGYDDKGLTVDYNILFLQPCTKEMMSPLAFEALGGQPVVDNTLCINPRLKMDTKGNVFEEDVIITNPYAEVGSTGFNIAVDICKDESEDCIKTQKALENGFFMGYASLSHFISTSDFQSPVKKMIKSGSVSVSSKMTVTAQMHFDVTQLSDDKGLVFEDLKTARFANFERLEVTYKIKEKNDNLLNLTFGTKGLVKHVERLYLKMTQLFANLGGLLKVMIMIGKIAATVSSKASFYYLIRNKVEQVKPAQNNASINNLVEFTKPTSIARSKNSLKGIPTLIQYLKGFFSRNTALKYGMDRKTLFKYFDVKLLEEKITRLEAKQREVDSTIFDIRNKTNA